LLTLLILTGAGHVEESVITVPFGGDPWACPSVAFEFVYDQATHDRIVGSDPMGIVKATCTYMDLI
jgi:hypothetical protein